MSDVALLVIGSGPAGVSAARSYAASGGPGPVLIVTSDRDEPYERPPLSKEVLAGEHPPTGDPIDGEKLPDDIELRLSITVSAVDLDAKTVTAGGENISFDRLVVATGAQPVTLPLVDPDAEVHLLRSLDDGRRVTQAADHARTALVIGSGFIGCEAAASLAKRGLEVTMVTQEASPQVDRLGADAAATIAGWLTELGVTLKGGVSLTAVHAPRTIHLDDGTTLSPNLILLAVGVQAGAGVLEGTGVQLHQGRVVADATLSAAPGVWVAGDSARAVNAAAGRPLVVEHWGDALAMGAVAGANAAADAAGSPAQEWADVPGFWSTIGEHTLQYAAWGDGFTSAETVRRTGGFTIWYGDDEGRVVGVLTYNADDDYERGMGLIADGASVADAIAGASAAEPDSDESDSESSASD